MKRGQKGIEIREAHFPGRAPMDAYGNGGFRFADMSHKGSLISLPSGIYGWNVTTPEDLTGAAFDTVFSEVQTIEVFLLGTGPDLVPVRPEVRVRFRERGIQIDFHEHRRGSADLQRDARGKPRRGSRLFGGLMADPNRYCLDLLAEENAVVYPALLFLPVAIREDVAALYAFHGETGRIAHLVSEPLPGEIRLQWWREVLVPEQDPEKVIDRSREGAANPLAKALLAVIAKHNLPKDGFARYLDARLFDLYNDAMPDRTALEAYFGESESFILQMAALVCGLQNDRGLADACGHGGVVIGLVQRIKWMPRDRAAHKTWLPEDLLASAGLDRESWLAPPENRHQMAVEAYIALAREHLDKAVTAIRELPKEARAVFLPLVLARAQLAKAPSGDQILASGLELSPLRQQLALWKTAMVGF